MKTKTAVIFGGTGFIGRQIVRELAAQGYNVKVTTRIPERAYFLRPCGAVGQVVPVACDYSEASIRAAVAGCDYVVNAIGILYQKKKGGFERAHVNIPHMIAAACKSEKAARFIHISALACERGTSLYAYTKLAGEAAVKKAFPNVTILRPSIVFGAEDSFFNMFAKLMRLVPVMPLIGGGKTKFQPVYVGDVAQAVIHALQMPQSAGNIYELGGTDTVTFKQVYQMIMHEIHRKRLLIPVPFAFAKIQGVLLSLLPRPLLTADQVESLKTDNIINPKALTLCDLGVAPTAMDMVVPQYLAHYRAGGAFAYQKAA